MFTIPNLKKIVIKSLDREEIIKILKDNSVGLSPALIIPCEDFYDDVDLTQIILKYVEAYLKKGHHNPRFPYPTYFFTQFLSLETDIPKFSSFNEILNFFREDHLYLDQREKRFLQKIRTKSSLVANKKIDQKMTHQKSMSILRTEILNLKNYNSYLENIIKASNE